VGFTTTPAESPANVYWDRRIEVPLVVQQSLFSDSSVGGRSEISFGRISLANDDGALNVLGDYDWDGRLIEVLYTEKERPVYADFIAVFSGTAEQFLLGDIVEIEVRDLQILFEEPFQPSKFLGTGGVEGPTEYTGRRKPHLLGTKRQFTPLPLDPANLVWCYHSGPAGGVLGVKDSGADLPYAGDYPSYAALIAASIPAGQYATCNALGLLRLNAPPIGVLTIDAEGQRENLLISPFTLTRTQAGGASSTALNSDGLTWREYVANAARTNGTARGRLLEGERTNGIRNIRAEGTAGALPTNWARVNAGSGVNPTYSAITANGMTGLRITYVGTTAGVPGTETIEFDGRTPGIFAANAGVLINSSFFYRLSSGALPVGAPVVQNRIVTFNNAGTVIAATGQNFTALDGDIRRTSHTHTPAAGVGVNGRAISGIHFGTWPASTAVNFSIDVFWPQLETGWSASSPILPTSGTPASATRGSDIVSAPLSSLGVPSTGTCTVLWSGVIPQQSPTGFGQNLVQLEQTGSDANSYRLRNPAASNSIDLMRVNAGVVSSISLGTMTPGTAFRAGFVINGSGRMAGSFNGGAVQAVTGGVTTGLTDMRVGNIVSGLQPLFGDVAVFRVLPYALSDADLQTAVAALPVVNGTLKTFADIAQHSILRSVPLTLADFNPTTVSALNTSCSQGLGYWYGGDSEEPLRGVLDTLASSVGVYYGFDESRKIFFGRFEAPAVTPDYVFSERDIYDLQPIPADRRLKTQIVAWGERVRPLEDQEIAGTITGTSRTALMEKWRLETHTSSSVATASLLAREERIDSSFDVLADAQNEAQRRVALFGPRRQAFTVEVPFTPNLRPGHTVELQDSRLIGVAKRFRVLKIERDASEQRVTMEVWG
jgi:hypothetical protein